MTSTASALIIASALLISAEVAFAATASGASSQADIWRAAANNIPVGSSVSVRTTSGERFSPVLYFVDDIGVTLKPKTRVPQPLRRLTFDRIDEIEVRRDRVNILKYIAAGAAFGGALFLGLVVAASSG